MAAPRSACARGPWLIVAAALASSAPAQAGDWRVTPRISATETYSDNVDLAPDGQEEHDFVTQVTPGIGITGTGRRLNLSFDYQGTFSHYARGTDSSGLDHRLQGIGTAEVYEDHLFLDFSATVSQLNVSNQRRLSRDTISASDNRETVATFQASPYWRQRIGSYADATLRYEGGTVQSGTTTDTNFNSFSAVLASGSAFARAPWTLTARYRREDNSTDTTNTFRDVGASVRYQFTRQYGTRLSVGYASSDAVNVTGDDSGVTWGVTGIWTPTPRTSVEAGVRHQLIGTSFTLNATHRMRKAVFNAAYDESQTTTARQRLERRLFPLVDAFGEPILDPGLQPVLIPIDIPTSTDQTVISRRFSGAMTLQGRRTNATLSGYHQRRTFELSGDDETVIGLNASASRSLSRQSNATLGGFWQRSEFEGGREDNLYGFDVSYRRSLARDLSASVTYQHTRNESDRVTNEYSENRIAASVTMLF